MEFIQKLMAPDNWLSGILGYPVYKLDIEKISTPEVIQSGKRLSELISSLEKKVFIYTKINTSDTQNIKVLQKCGFNLVDTNVVFKKKINSQNIFSKNISIRFAEINDRESTSSLSSKTFIYSRFHLDNEIDNKIANQIKEEWVNNFFLGKRGKAMVVAELEKKIIGFLQLLVSDDNDLIIDLIGVDYKFRNMDVAKNMIFFAENNFPDCNNFIVGTQIANIPSIRLYEKLGFQLIESKYVFHYHSNQNEF